MVHAADHLSAQELETLSTKAIAAKDTAYCPYSKFRVGACILTESGEFVQGANVENASYPVGTCAERVAFGNAIWLTTGFARIAAPAELVWPE
ncbi:cytidine deaminase [Aspergillus luchuensis]|uniref:Cytidine deaminase n=1 Tax=Aspergillus kawachii TaxID=1069201 RepID=A0A146FW67_ASPKA|nr:cytidine deaminase [Aspergillus luchuensis]